MGRHEEIQLQGISTTDRTPPNTSAAPSIVDEYGRLNSSVSSSTNVVNQESDVPPDGGWEAWRVLVACSVITFWYGGTAYSWGIFQAALLEENNHLASTSTIAFVGSMLSALIAFLAIFNAKLVRVMGARAQGVAGISLLGGGEVLAGFATKSIGGLFACVGIVMGVGVSFCFTACSTTPSQYFVKRRGLANGVVFFGGGLGGAVLSFVIQGLVSSLGSNYAFWILGCITLSVGIPAALCIKERGGTEGRKIRRQQGKFVEWAFFKDLEFCLIFISGAIATFPLFVPPFFLPLFAQSIGLSVNEGAGLVAGFNLASAAGRLGFGQISDRIGPLNSLLIALFLASISSLCLWPFASTLPPLIIFVVLNGIGNGGFFSLMPTTVASLFGSTRVAVALGMIVTAWGSGYLLGAPIAGFLLAAYGGSEAGLSAYRPAIFFSGGLTVAAAIPIAVVRIRRSAGALSKV